MAGSYPVLQLGPATYEVSVAVTGGQVVMVDGTTGKVKVAAAAADGTTVIGVALDDAVPTGSGDNVHFGTARNKVAVAYGPAEVILKATGDIAFGAQVVCAVAGTVATVGAGTFGQVVGRCTEPAGITGGSTGRVRLA